MVDGLFGVIVAVGYHISTGGNLSLLEGLLENVYVCIVLYIFVTVCVFLNIFDYVCICLTTVSHF